MADIKEVAVEGKQKTMKGNIVEHASEDISNERLFLKKMLNKTLRIKISDGRTLIGTFLCTDKDQNIILGQCQEYVKPNGPENGEEARILGLAMIPGRHITSIDIDINLPEFRTSDKPSNSLKLANFT